MEILAASIGALLAAISGYFLGIRQTNLQRQREQQWRIFQAIRRLEELDADTNAEMELDKYNKLFEKHREIVLLNLVQSGLPEMKEIVRAVNPIGFPDSHSRSNELKRLSEVILRRLDPAYFRAMDELNEEWAKLGVKEKDIISPERNKEIMEKDN